MQPIFFSALIQNIVIVSIFAALAYLLNEPLLLALSTTCLYALPDVQALSMPEEDEGGFASDEKDYEPKVGFTAKG